MSRDIAAHVMPAVASRGSTNLDFVDTYQSYVDSKRQAELGFELGSDPFLMFSHSSGIDSVLLK
jgi:hypothetical protein